ncbi:amino acid permease [Actinomadura viridis]|uniref:Amino acid efflux transporter n=1 Tax=Actinomadura viridis TaxID=58110 RepID=A0A931DKG8_9ACTN|nr:amino acid permease [Actinomadura viridis]MBG6091102.1 amino acid efflux transporter [Actinomadura viridis]
MTETGRLEPPAENTENAKQAEAARLQGHLRLPSAVALAITIIVGSGALVTPGIAFQRAGEAALYSWIAAAVLTLPLLVMFAKLGAAHPGAGGIAGFTQAAFGRHAGAGVELLLMGTFGLGIPGIALTGANYLRAIPGLSGLPVSLGAAILLVAAAGVVFTGVRLSARVQLVLALVLTIALLAIGFAGTVRGAPLEHVPPPDGATLEAAVLAIGLIFFAFTGWEMITFTTEEYVDPRRDFPRVLVLSFVIVVTMYLLLAWAVQAHLPRDADTTASAPVQALVEGFASSAAPLVSVLGVVIIAANLVGAIWGASRLVMSSAREGLLPPVLARVNGADNPRQAVAACAAGFLAVIAASAVGWTSLSDLLTIAGQNFFLIYVICSAGYLWLFPGGHRIFGVLVTAVLAAIAVTFGPLQLAYAAVLVVLGVVLSRLRTRTR